MSQRTADVNIRPEPDRELTDIADYVIGYRIDSAEAYETARYCLMDALDVPMPGAALPRVREAPRGQSSPARRPGRRPSLRPLRSTRCRPPSTSAR
jgi:2-methylcitrate dehydratase PrpD